MSYGIKLDRSLPTPTHASEEPISRNMEHEAISGIRQKTVARCSHAEDKKGRVGTQSNDRTLGIY